MPPEGDLVAAQAGGSNSTSSDFVRKLYKMLEDPAYSSVVRWSNEGDSFVVLENEKFTKSILPKHFKHSNFASFVRQLNKYDFHKVRHTDDNGEAPYGKDAWEFRHPEFRADRKDNLDNIRRKAPAPRKQPQAEEPFPATQQIALLNDQLVATQHQVQALQEQYFELANSNKALIGEIVSLQKMVKAQSQVANELVNHLNNVDDRRRSSRHSAHSSHSSHSGAAFHSNNMGVLPDGADEPAAELRRAREILNGLSPDTQATERKPERLAVPHHPIAGGSPPDSATSVMFTQPNAAAPMQMIQDPLNDMRHMVYPVGQTTGIDPFHSDHIQNIPYSRPLSNPTPLAEAPPQITPPPKDLGGSLWGAKKPRILLVEDDRTCARIGSKFLSHVDCNVEVARDGSEAVNKVNSEPDRYDLIFMDIIMPMFDGVSATACIRLVSPRVPIVAMTSNIRQEDIATYFHWGMNDVLAKPFTKDGMVRILRKHLPYLLKNPPPPGSTADEMGAPTAGQAGPVPPYPNSAGMSMGQMAGPAAMSSAGAQMKFEGTPIQSPATSSSWHSPSQISHTSPALDNGGYMNAVGPGQGMILTPGGTQRQQYAGVPQVAAPTLMRPDGLGGMGDDRPEKRQRLYGPSQGAYSQ